MAKFLGLVARRARMGTAGLVVVGLVFTGCSSTGTDSSSSGGAVGASTAGGAGAAGSAGAGGAGPATAITWATATVATSMPAEQKVIDNCSKTMNLDVKVEQIPFTNYDTKMTTSLRGGNGPDVFRVNHPNVQAWANAGFLADLSAPIAAGTIKTGQLIPGLVNIGKVAGKQFSLPNDTDARVLFYNTTLLKSAGIVDSTGAALPPATWSELVADVAKFTGGTYGFAFRADSDYAMAYEAVGPFMKAAQGVVVSNGATPQAVAGDDKNTIAAVQLLQDIVATGSTPPGESTMSDATIANLFAAGKLALYTGGPWERPQIEAANPKFLYGANYKTAVIPVPKAGEKSASTSGGWQNGINSKSKHLDADYKFLNCMEEPANLISLGTSGSFPPVLNGMDSPTYAKDPFFDAFKTVLPNSGLPITPVAQLAQVSAAFEQAVLPALLAKKSPQAQLQSFDEQTNAEILR